MSPSTPSSPLAARWRGAATLALAFVLLAAAAPGQPPAAPAAPVAPAAPAAPAIAPNVIAPDPVWDAGIVARGAKVSHEFVLRNQGHEMLQVREVRPACGCTVVSFDAAIPPGGEGKVHAEVDTSAFSGAIAKEVTVFTSDPGNPAIQLTIRAEVRSAVEAQPGYFRFLHTQGAPAESSSQVLWSADHPGLEVLSVTSPQPSITVTFHPAKPADRDPQGSGKQWVVVATIAAEPPAGPLSGEVRVETNHPRKRFVDVPIAGYVRPLLMVTPPTADFGTFPAGEPRKGSVLIVNNGSTPLQLLGVDSDVRGLTARIDERKKGKDFGLALALGPDLPKGPFAGTLRVRTTSPQHPVLEVPVKGVVN